MKYKSTVAAIVLAAALPTFAVAQSQGKQQLAAIVGVEPDMFTLSQLSELQAAMRSGDTTAIRTILDDAGSEMTAEQLMAGGNGDMSMEERMGQADAFYDQDYSEGKQQLAANLNLEPGDFTLAQLAELSAAKNESDAAKVRAIFEEAGVDMTAEQFLN